jgi:O-antigen/teichoic acid export membrane protein
MMETVKRYSNFPKYDMWATLLNSVSWQIPIFLLSYFFTTTVVGYYSLGMMMIQLPMSLIGGSIGQVFFQRAAEANFGGTLDSLVENVFKILFKLGIFPMLILLLMGKDIFTVFFGPQWGIAGIYVQILSIWAFVWFISSPLGEIVLILEKQSWGLWWNMIVFSSRLISFIIGGILGDVFIALLLFSLSGVIVYGYFIVKSLGYSGLSLMYIFRQIYFSMVQIILAGIILSIMMVFQVNLLITFIVACALGLLYYLYLIKTEPSLYSMLIQNIIPHNKPE